MTSTLSTVIVLALCFVAEPAITSHRVAAQTACNPASVIDSQITLGSPNDVVACQQAIINAAFGTSAGQLPTTLPVVTPAVVNPFPSFTNVAEVDNYHDPATPPQAYPEDALLYIAGPVSSGKVVILNGGHQGTCDWTAFDPGFNLQATMQGLLNAGHSVFAMNMLGCGTNDDLIVGTYGNLAIGYYVAAAVEAMNYWDVTGEFNEYDMVGLSGGGWTTEILAALDPRVTTSFADAGSMPGIAFIDPFSGFPAEYTLSSYYGIAGFLDHYIMDSYGSGRTHIQILNYNDDCCFGPAEWGPTLQGYYGETWDQYVANYANNIAAALTAISPSSYQLIVDMVATQHQISTYAQSLILSTLGGSSSSPAPSARNRQLTRTSRFR